MIHQAAHLWTHKYTQRNLLLFRQRSIKCLLNMNLEHHCIKGFEMKGEMCGRWVVTSPPGSISVTVLIMSKDTSWKILFYFALSFWDYFGISTLKTAKKYGRLMLQQYHAEHWLTAQHFNVNPEKKFYFLVLTLSFCSS